MLPPEVRELRRPVEDQAAIDLLADAFLEFPAMRVVVGTDDGARGRLRRLFEIEFDGDHELGVLGAYHADTLVGALTYLDSPACSAKSSRDVLRFMRIAGPRVVRSMRMFGRVGRAHPKTPHRHLPSVGIAPAFQSRGVGTVLMEAFHERSDAEGTVAYLETIRWSDPGRPSHERFYGRLGYRVLEVVPMADEWAMLTMARSPGGVAEG